MERRFNNGLTNENKEITIVITGFGPFREHVVNSSWEAVRLIPNRGIDLPENIKEDTPVHIIAYLMPVEYKCIADIVPKIWDKHKPDVSILTMEKGCTFFPSYVQFGYRLGPNLFPFCRKVL